jgi:TrpR-related protein YerC/YecD
MSAAKILETENGSLYDAVMALQSVEECQAFLNDLCTPAELEAFQERWNIVKMLDQGDKSYRQISAMTGASTTTIGRVARFLQQESNKGYKLILNRIRG